MAKWLGTLEKKLEQYSLDGHDSYRVYISAEPAGTRDSHIIPQGILESSIKITNEPPTGMLANLHKALDNFNQVGSSWSLFPRVVYISFHTIQINSKETIGTDSKGNNRDRLQSSYVPKT